MSGITREVVTLQLGHFSNYVGTHWWNLQEASFAYSPQEMCGPKEINHDVLFREGKNLMGDVTYTPRLVAVDLKGSLNTLKQDGILYDIPMHEEDLQWQSDVNLHKQELAQKNEYLQDLEDSERTAEVGSTGELESDQDESSCKLGKDDNLVFGQTKFYDLDDSVTVWSDFLRTHLHPRSVHIVEDYQHNNDLQRFDLFGLGRQVLKNNHESDSLDDRLHFFLEECDSLQGIHLLVDTQNGFGGLGASMLEKIEDDYATKGLFVVGLSPPPSEMATTTDHCYQLLNTVMSYNTLSSLSSAFVPLSTVTTMGRRPGQSVLFPHLQYKPYMWYHSSALLGASLDTMTLPYRLDSLPSLMTHMTDAMAVGSRKILGLQTSLPFPFREDGTLANTFMGLGRELPWQPITPMLSSQSMPFAQSVVLRGIPFGQVKGSGPQSEVQIPEPAEELLQGYLRGSYSSCLSASCVLHNGCKVGTPFPHIFSPKVNTQGHLSAVDRLGTGGVDSVPVMTSLQATQSSGNLLNHLVSEVGQLNVRKFNRFLEAGIEEDEFSETVNSLKSSAQGYDTSTEVLL